MIPFFKTTLTGNEKKYVERLLTDEDAPSQKNYIQKCEEWFRDVYGFNNFFLTKSCTHALELAALVLDLKTGDEVIMPSYAFVACANAFALRGAIPVFVDIDAATMNISAAEVEKAITTSTKAIVTLNYAGVGCDYKVLKEMASKYNIPIVEDNAHGIGAKHNGNYLGSFGDISTFSFDHLKNITSFQGGGIVINNEEYLERFYVAYEFGTNRRLFFKGKADRYEWTGLGSNYPLPELNAAFLFAQLKDTCAINSLFMHRWKQYAAGLLGLAKKGQLTIPSIQNDNEHNAHCFYIKSINTEVRIKLIEFLQQKEINAQFHYTPLHSSRFGKHAGKMASTNEITTFESQRLLRLPLYYSITDAELDEVIDAVNSFYK